MKDSDFSHWNHRVVRHKHPRLDEHWYAIHEVHYRSDGTPRAVTQQPTGASGETVEEVRWSLEKMIEALDKPVLDYKDFHGEGKDGE